MQEHLLKTARDHAERADAPLRAAALLRIARAPDVLEGLDAVQNLTSPAREYHRPTSAEAPEQTH